MMTFFYKIGAIALAIMSALAAIFIYGQRKKSEGKQEVKTKTMEGIVESVVEAREHEQDEELRKNARRRFSKNKK